MTERNELINDIQRLKVERNRLLEQIKEAEYADRHFRLSRGERSTRGSLQYLQYSSEEVCKHS